MAELEKNPAFLERRRKQEEERFRRSEDYARAEAPLRNALHAAGSQVSSVWDLVNTSSPYPELVPLLLDHIDRPYSDEVREGIVRALAVREARVGWNKLVRLYLSEPPGRVPDVKWEAQMTVR